MESAANPDAANPPAIAIPETLPLPVAAAIGVVGHIGRTAVIAVTGSVVAGTVIAGTGQRAANNGAADHSGGHTGDPALRLGRSGHHHGRNSQGGDGSECHQCLPHGVTFLNERSADKQSVAAKVPYFT